jgi:hypothetical protein
MLKLSKSPVIAVVVCCILINVVNPVNAQSKVVPRITACKAVETGMNPAKVSVTANVVDAATGAAINGASVTITCGTLTTNTVTNAQGNCDGRFNFPALTTNVGANCKVCVMPNAASAGSDKCCTCTVGGTATAPAKGSGGGEIAYIVLIGLVLIWAGFKFYKNKPALNKA